MPEKISIGVPFYGELSGEWVAQTMQLTASIAASQTLCDIIFSGTMTADHNRNLIASEFLKSKADWLLWIDSDTKVPVGAVDRLLAHGRTLVSGLYYGKNEPHNPIAYYVYNGAFLPIDKQVRWEHGEILPVDAAGMGCMLTHRTVFEDIQREFHVFQIPGGGLKVVHQDDILTTEEPIDWISGSVVDGYLHVKVTEPTLADMKFPFFMIEHNRTEDMFFFDLAVRVGHKPVLDTGVECAHLRWEGYTGEDYRNRFGH